jgi:TPR repeat protein
MGAVRRRADLQRLAQQPTIDRAPRGNWQLDMRRSFCDPHLSMQRVRFWLAYIIVSLSVSCGSTTKPALAPVVAAAAVSNVPPPNACDAGDLSECFKIAMDTHYGRNGRTLDRKKAAGQFVALCAKGHGVSCYNAAVAYEQGEAVSKDLFEATALYEKACRATDAEVDGCRDAGNAYEEGQGVPRDFAHAEELFRIGCAENEPTNCLYVAFVLIKRDAPNADVFAAYKQACDVGALQACHNVAVNYESGDRTTRDPDKAKLMYQHACNQGYQDSCDAIELMVRNESYRRTRAQMWQLERTCKNSKSDTQSCRDLAYMYWNGINVAENEDKVAFWNELGCKKGDGESCYQLAMMLDGGTNVAVDMKRSMVLYERGCNLNSGGACFNLGVYLDAGEHLAKDPARAFASFEKSCKIGDKKDCVAVGTALRTGSGVAKDLAMSAAYFSIACQAGSGPGCYEMGVAYENGLGVPKDEAKASESYREACKAGDSTACSRADETDKTVDTDLLSVPDASP